MAIVYFLCASISVGMATPVDDGSSQKTFESFPTLMEYRQYVELVEEHSFFTITSGVLAAQVDVEDPDWNAVVNALFDSHPNRAELVNSALKHSCGLITTSQEIGYFPHLAHPIAQATLENAPHTVNTEWADEIVNWMPIGNFTSGFWLSGLASKKADYWIDLQPQPDDVTAISSVELAMEYQTYPAGTLSWEYPEATLEKERTGTSLSAHLWRTETENGPAGKFSCRIIPEIFQLLHDSDGPFLGEGGDIVSAAMTFRVHRGEQSHTFSGQNVYVLRDNPRGAPPVQYVESKEHLASLAILRAIAQATDPNNTSGLEELKGKQFPEINLVDWASENTHLRQSEFGVEGKITTFDGNVVLIDFWETWCGPCRKAMPYLSELHEKYYDRGLRVLSLCHTERSDAAQIDQFAEKHSHLFDVIDAATSKAFPHRGIPTYVLIDSNDQVVWFSVGGTPPEDVIQSYLPNSPEAEETEESESQDPE